MAQGRQQNNGSRQRCAQSAAAKAPAEPPKAVCAQLEQMNRKLAAASAEILRYQTQRQIVKDFLIKFTKKPQKSARSRF